ncbi:hypothetical protein CEUSTIGMA_g12205.t1 [Chlamydomonas eustigma]|uniref:RNA polymerase subunit H/Rpb5 C-terminal domain-containing protein n=1 Tax=Chlamydomonas eustigma TaxID=1157962 RepID=A0A250XP55_9CHLO|nr:hypothetical protein CEUSTIGMA_g12205.t1 [Chlamydomonas eustigma]|eukprot:GAX84783.1 hypothetical protein CEUSTIGMA_g12205.t1 [Chlamydomonas eustigma]
MPPIISEPGREVRRSFQVIRNMLKKRSLDVSSLDGVSNDAIAALAEDTNVFSWDVPSCKTRIVYNLNPKFKTPDIKKVLAAADDSVQTFIVVVRDIPPQAKTFEELTQKDVQLFLIRELQFDVTEHELVPNHVPIRDAEGIEAVLARYRLKVATQLPLILSSDVIARYFALKPMQLWPEHAPRADCGRALMWFASQGRLDVVRLLLEWPEHAPRADCQDGRVMVWSAWEGHLEVVRLLLEWPEHAPRADCLNGIALESAAVNGHLDVVRLLLEWPKHAPRADCRDGQALVAAAKNGHLSVVRLLLEWPKHAPRANCGQALVEAAQNSHLWSACFGCSKQRDNKQTYLKDDIFNRTCVHVFRS